MEKILYLTGIVTRLSTSGCIFPDGDRGGTGAAQRLELRAMGLGLATLDQARFHEL